MNRIAIFVTENPRWCDAGAAVSAYKSAGEIRRMISHSRPEELVGRTIEEVLLEALDSFRSVEILTEDYPEGGYWKSREAFAQALERARKDEG